MHGSFHLKGKPWNCTQEVVKKLAFYLVAVSLFQKMFLFELKTVVEEVLKCHFGENGLLVVLKSL